MSLQLQVLRWIAKPMLARNADPVAARRRFRLVAAGFRTPPLLLHVVTDLHRVTVRPTTDDWAILYFHGGGYITGSPLTHEALAGRIASLTGLPVFLPEYPLAP